MNRNIEQTDFYLGLGDENINKKRDKFLQETEKINNKLNSNLENILNNHPEYKNLSSTLQPINSNHKHSNLSSYAHNFLNDFQNGVESSGHNFGSHRDIGDHLSLTLSDNGVNSLNARNQHFLKETSGFSNSPNFENHHLNHNNGNGIAYELSSNTNGNLTQHPYQSNESNFKLGRYSLHNNSQSLNQAKVAQIRAARVRERQKLIEQSEQLQRKLIIKQSDHGVNSPSKQFLEKLSNFGLNNKVGFLNGQGFPTPNITQKPLHEFNLRGGLWTDKGMGIVFEKFKLERNLSD